MDEDLKHINNLVCEMLGAVPLIAYKEPTNDVDAEWNSALARMYSDRGFRTYLENAVNLFTRAAAIGSADIVSLTYNKARIITLKELLIVSKNAFEQLNKIKSGTQVISKERYIDDGRTLERIGLPQEEDVI